MGQASTQQSQQIIANWANFYGVPSWIPLSIAQVESGLNPNAQGDVNAQKQPTSFGLFQLHQGGGQGDGYSTAQLLDPNLNSQIGIGHMVAPYQEGMAQGLTGYSLLSYVAAHSGHPTETGTLPSSYNTSLQSAFQQVTGQGGSGQSSQNTTSNSGGLSGGSGVFGGLTTAINKGVFVILGAGIIILGVWIMFNPLSDLSSAVRTIGNKVDRNVRKSLSI